MNSKYKLNWVSPQPGFSKKLNLLCGGCVDVFVHISFLQNRHIEAVEKWKRILYKIWPLLLVFFIAACENKKSGNIPISANNEWMVEEVLDHLRELREDMAEVKNDIKAIKVALSVLDQGTATNPNIILNNQNVLGDKTAKIAIVEFSDYECPYCARHANAVFPLLKEKYIDTGKVAYHVRDFPLSFHSRAKSAAIATRCASGQDKYWQMREKIFQSKGSLNQEYYTKVAAELELDGKEFQRCFQDEDSMRKLEEDVSYGNSIGVSGTPRFYVGKVDGSALKEVVVISGAQSLGVFSEVIDKLL